MPDAIEPWPTGEFDAPATGGADEAAVDAGRSVVEALSVAWATFTAFEDPRGLEAFERAIELLANCPWYPIRLEIAPAGFASRGVPLASRREAARRMARSTFAHGIGGIEIAAPPSPDDLLHLLRLMASPPDGTDPSPLLGTAGVESIVLLHRRLLVDEAEGFVDDDEITDFDVLVVTDEDEERAEQEPETEAAMFMTELTLGLSMLAEDDHEGRAAALHTFVNAFSGMSRTARAAAIGELLRSDDPAAEIFLDQLGSLELGDLASRLDSDTHPLLMEYARLAAEQGEQRHVELLGLLTNTETGGGPIGLVIAESVQEALRAGAREAPAAIARLRDLRPGRTSDTVAGVNVIKGLLAVVGDESFFAVARSWADKVADAVAIGDLEHSDSLFAAIVGIPMADGRQAALLDVLGAAFAGPALDAAADAVAWAGDGPGRAIRRTAPLFLSGPLIRHAAANPDARRRLAPALAILARIRPAPFLAHLEDRNPLVVATAAFALGASKSAEVVKRIEGLLDHSNPTVRVQALGTLHTIVGDAATPTLLEALDDAHEKVRSRASRILASIDDPRIDEVLLARLDRTTDPAEQTRAIDVLAKRTSPKVAAHLTDLASKRFAWSRRVRHLRDEARRVLGAGT
ncbi:HEAT repeat domain-containing protein [bacterium]|nr:HEAT repeat domain-containing protein [bacterium]